MSSPLDPRSCVQGLSARHWRCTGMLAALLSAAAPLSGSSVALAQSAAATPSSSAAASREEQAAALFRQARSLLDQGSHAEACGLFARSLELKVSPAILLNLGNCHERDGDLLRSAATFERAIAEARVEPDPVKRKKWLDAATQRRTTVLERIPMVLVKPSPTPDVRVTIDGSAPDGIGGLVKMNPGHHRLEATADGKQPHVREFDLAPGQKLQIDLPALVELPTRQQQLAAQAVNIPPADAARAQSQLPWVFLGAGAGLGAISVVTALVTQSKENELDERCDAAIGGTRTCNDPALASVKASGENWELSTYLLWGAAAVSVGVGVTLLAVGGEDSASTTVQARCSGASCGMSASGRF